MESLQSTLQKKLQSLQSTPQGVRKVNNAWEQAKEFCEYIGVPNDSKNIINILSLCKRYGAGKVYETKSFLKDTEFDKKKVAGLIVWRIQQTDTKLTPQEETGSV